MESSSFVLHCTPVMTQPGISAHRTEGNPMFGIEGGGHSAVYAPDGRRLTKPLPADEEGFMYADLDKDLLATMRHLADPVGQYSWPELLWLGVDAREKGHVRREGEGGTGMEVLRKQVNAMKEAVEKFCERERERVGRGMGWDGEGKFADLVSFPNSWLQHSSAICYTIIPKSSPAHSR